MKSPTLVLAGSGVALAVLLAGCGNTHASSAEDSVRSVASAADEQSAGAVSNADISFAQLMIPHHQQAVEMADLALARATSPEVRELAVQIKAAQDPEIEVMTGWLQAWGAPMTMDDDHGSHDMGGLTMSGMMTDEDMQSLADATGAEFDQKWLAMMIAHHKGAIDMAEAVRVGSGNADVTALAEAVISGQSAEIEAMQEMLAP